MIRPSVIAEIGCNHQGDFEYAKRMIRVAADVCGVYACKFQKRTIEEMPEDQRNRIYDNKNSFGKTYGEHRKALEFSVEQHAELHAYCEELGVHYSTSVWDITAAKQVVEIIPNVRFLKIPSAKNHDLEMIRWLVDNYEGKIHISMGMTSLDEKLKLKAFLNSCPDHNRFVIYHCTSAYPVENWADLSLRDISTYCEWMRQMHLFAIGYSGHNKGIAVDNIALAMGARYFERHFTLDRTLKGTDHAASLEPHGLAKLVRDLSVCSDALCSSNLGVKNCELSARGKLKNEN